MKYKIKKDSFVKEDDKNGIITLRASSNNRLLFLKDTMANLLDVKPDEWVLVDKTDIPDETIYKDYEDALTLLNCFDIAEIIDDKVITNLYVAGEKEYRILSPFIINNNGKGLSTKLKFSDSYYSEDNLRYRQFNNEEYNFYYKENDDIKAVINFHVTAPTDLTDIGTFQYVIFKDGLSAEGSKELFDKLLLFVEKKFHNDLVKLRFEFIGNVDDFIVDEIIKCGYSHVATLEKEIDGKKDLIFYEKRI